MNLLIPNMCLFNLCLFLKVSIRVLNCLCICKTNLMNASIATTMMCDACLFLAETRWGHKLMRTITSTHTHTHTHRHGHAQKIAPIGAACAPSHVLKVAKREYSGSTNKNVWRVTRRDLSLLPLIFLLLLLRGSLQLSHDSLGTFDAFELVQGSLAGYANKRLKVRYGNCTAIFSLSGTLRKPWSGCSRNTSEN